MSEQNVQMIIKALEMEKMTKMTNEEAIYVLNLLKRQDLKINSAATEAIDMAISALKKQEVNKCCETCKHKSHSAQEIPCCDCYMASCFEDCYEPYTEEES